MHPPPIHGRAPTTIPPLPAPKPLPPPKLFYQHFLPTLPAYTGSSHVGYIDLELPASPLFQTQLPNLSTILLAIYYPTTFNDDLTKSERRKVIKHKAGSPVHWSSAKGKSRKDLVTAVYTGTGLKKKKKEASSNGDAERNGNGYGQGARYVCGIRLPKQAVRGWVKLTGWGVTLPVIRNGALKDFPPALERVKGESYSLDVIEEEDEEDEEDQGQNGNMKKEEEPKRKKYPVIIFSHGLGGSRTAYSSICGELASHGFVVVAIEHRDGSATRTCVTKPRPEHVDSDSDDQGLKTHDQDRKKKKQKAKEHYTVRYIAPADKNASPHDEGGVDTETRQAQLTMRLAEIEEACRILQLINGGDAEDEIQEKNLRKDGDVDWKDWYDRLHLDSITTMGHCFGGTTALQALRSERLGWISQGVVLDPCVLCAIPDFATWKDTERLQKPVLLVGSDEATTQWTENFEHIKKMCRQTQQQQEDERTGTLCMTTLKGSTTHISQTDFAVLYPNCMSALMKIRRTKPVVKPKRAIHLTFLSALEFLNSTLPPHQTKFLDIITDSDRLPKDMAVSNETSVRFDHRLG